MHWNPGFEWADLADGQGNRRNAKNQISSTKCKNPPSDPTFLTMQDPEPLFFKERSSSMNLSRIFYIWFFFLKVVFLYLRCFYVLYCSFSVCLSVYLFPYLAIISLLCCVLVELIFFAKYDRPCLQPHWCILGYYCKSFHVIRYTMIFLYTFFTRFFPLEACHQAFQDVNVLMKRKIII